METTSELNWTKFQPSLSGQEGARQMAYLEHTAVHTVTAADEDDAVDRVSRLCKNDEQPELRVSVLSVRPGVDKEIWIVEVKVTEKRGASPARPAEAPSLKKCKHCPHLAEDHDDGFCPHLGCPAWQCQ